MGLANENRVTRHRISVEDYYRMGEAGIFSPEARVELIDGKVIDRPRSEAVTRAR